MNTNNKILFGLTHNDLFQKECGKVKSKIKRSELVVTIDKKAKRLYFKNYGLTESLVIKEPYRIAKEFNLPSEWAESIRNHILTDEPLQLPPVQSILLFDKDLGRWELYSPLHKKTSQLDLENVLKATKKIRKTLKEVLPKKLTKRDLVLLSEYQQGKNMKEITQTIGNSLDEESVKRRLTTVRRELSVKVRDRKTPKKLST